MKLVHITIQTKRFEDEINFYKKYAGLRILRELNTGSRIAFLANKEGDTEVEIIDNLVAEEIYNSNISIGYQADDLDAIHKRLTDDGFQPGEFISPIPQVRFFFVKSPSGISVQFIN